MPGLDLVNRSCYVLRSILKSVPYVHYTERHKEKLSTMED